MLYSNVSNHPLNLTLSPATRNRHPATRTPKLAPRNPQPDSWCRIFSAQKYGDILTLASSPCADIFRSFRAFLQRDLYAGRLGEAEVLISQPADRFTS